MSSTDPSDPHGKPTARRMALLRRDAMSVDERRTASRAIADRARVVILDGRSKPTVAVYAAKGSEVDVEPLAALLADDGCRVVYPRVVEDSLLLAFHVTREPELVAGRFGLREPAPDAPVVALDQIDAFLVPGLAFDRAGGRIGWGRGHYDATLAGARDAFRLGVAFECQLVAHVPHDVHDVPVHAVVTEHLTYRTAS